MRRFERKRLERARRRALTIGLSFAIGALTMAGLTWRQERAGVRPVPQGEHKTDRGTTGTAGADAPQAAAIGPALDTPVISPRDRELAMPVDGVDRRDLRDTFSEARGGNRSHEALDIMAPRGTPVRAVRSGRIEKLFTSQAGGLAIYQFDESGTYSYYYAHLDRYAASLAEGQDVDSGDLLGYVGSSGNAAPDAPHLHFAIFRLTPARQWWKGDPLNPYPLLK